LPGCCRDRNEYSLFFSGDECSGESLIGRNKIFGDGIGDDGVDDRFNFSVEEFRLIDVFILASPVRSSDSDIFLTL